MNIREALLQRQFDVDHSCDRYERRVSVAGADSAILSLKQGDVLSISDLEGCQSGEVYAVSDDGTPIRLFATPVGRRLADVVEQMGAKAAAVRHEIAARNIDPTKLTSEKILAGENPAGTSVSVKIPHDALVIVHAVGDAMLPQIKIRQRRCKFKSKGIVRAPVQAAMKFGTIFPNHLQRRKKKSASGRQLHLHIPFQKVITFRSSTSRDASVRISSLSTPRRWPQARNWRSMRPRPEP